MDNNVIDKIIELRKLNVSMRKISKSLNISIGRVRYYSRKNGLGGIRVEGNRGNTNLNENIKNFKKRFENKFPNFEYIDGYIFCESTVVIRCRECKMIQNRIASCVRNRGYITCKHCNNGSEFRTNKYKREIEKQQERIEKLEKARLEKLEKLEVQKKAKIKTKECAECGQMFETTKDNVKCCSKKCTKKRTNRNKDKRIYKNGEPDLTITLTKLIKRDKGICYICGAECNEMDFYYIKNTFIAGEDYPSVDHVIPISKGGKHQWDNIKLAHRKCNIEKRDKTTYGLEGNQIRFII